MQRLFIGIKITCPESIINLQEQLQHLLQRSTIKWVEPDNFHLTMKFLGDVESHIITPLIQVLEHLAPKFNQFVLQSDGLGTFGKSNNPHIIWYGFKENPILSFLQTKIEKTLHQLGFESDEKKFSPHLTLGRIKFLVERKELALFLQKQDHIPDHYQIQNFQLVESILKKEGPVYKTIKSFQLNKNN